MFTSTSVTSVDFKALTPTYSSPFFNFFLFLGGLLVEGESAQPSGQGEMDDVGKTAAETH